MTFICSKCGKEALYEELPQPRIYLLGQDFSKAAQYFNLGAARKLPEGIKRGRIIERHQSIKEVQVKTLIMMVGLPRSGKTTVALKEAKRLGAPIVSPDDIRLCLHGHSYLQSAEDFVWATAKLMVRALFKSHDTVILDACNNTVKRRDEWAHSDWQRRFITVDTAKEDCILRTPSMENVIERMAAAHEPVEEDEGMR